MGKASGMSMKVLILTICQQNIVLDYAAVIH